MLQTLGIGTPGAPRAPMHLLTALLGLDREPRNLDAMQIVLRALITYGIGVFLVRVGHKRFMGRNSAMDMLVAIMFGSVLGRGINGSAPFLASFGGAIALVLVHRAASALSWLSPWFRTLVEGRSRELVRDGEVRKDALAHARIPLDDLEESLRQEGKVQQVSQVELAVLERSGKISVLPRKQ